MKHRREKWYSQFDENKWHTHNRKLKPRASWPLSVKVIAKREAPKKETRESLVLVSILEVKSPPRGLRVMLNVITERRRSLRLDLLSDDPNAGACNGAEGEIWCENKDSHHG